MKIKEFVSLKDDQKVVFKCTLIKNQEQHFQTLNILQIPEVYYKCFEVEQICASYTK